ncbi:hypothetical protein OsI_23079 [Oryza sativa Indica Group]|uniref:Uncharacterized protein n=1 Tax=Oryza sativa subsp. indica TaxID=39946 RepID=B8B2U0_ORYSI|nr:hypothetical protein OsI_23079 [Oryza sativa Indica Group]
MLRSVKKAMTAVARSMVTVVERGRSCAQPVAGGEDLSPYSAVVDFAVTPKLSIDIDSKPFRKLLLPSKPRKHHASDR